MADQPKSADVNTREGVVTNQDLLALAMFTKQIQGGLNDIKRQANEVGGGLKVSDVDVTKVMPSHVLRTFKPTGPAPATIPQQGQAPVQAAPYIPPSVTTLEQPVYQGQVNINPGVPSLAGAGGSGVMKPATDPDQLEFDLNKQTRYEDIIYAIDKLENKINMLTDKVNILIDSNNKKKPKITNGTQAG